PSAPEIPAIIRRFERCGGSCAESLVTAGRGSTIRSQVLAAGAAMLAVSVALSQQYPPPATAPATLPTTSPATNPTPSPATSPATQPADDPFSFRGIPPSRTAKVSITDEDVVLA